MTRNHLEALVEATLSNMCAQSSALQDPLRRTLKAYCTQVRALDLDALKSLKYLLAARVCDEPELERRFLLRLLSDATEAVLEEHPFPYFSVA